MGGGAQNWGQLEELGPIAIKKLSEFQSDLHRGTAALVMGAGVDIEMARISGWSDLLNGLIRRSPHFRESRKRTTFRDVVNDFPTEFAYLARWSMGDKRFLQVLAQSVNPIQQVDFKNSFAQRLARLCETTNLIVTLNYSYILEEILRANLDPRIKIFVHDREELSTFNLPQPEANPQEIHLVHLHGRCSDRSLPILDAWGYNIAREDSREYMDFLRYLFEQRTVLMIGCSLLDIPLRDAAAFVKRRLLYANKPHVALYYESTPRPKYKQVILRSALRSALGIEVVPVSGGIQGEALQSLSNHALTPDPSDIQSIAVFFDTTGDFDSHPQHSWIKQLGEHKAATAATATTLTQGIKAALDQLHTDLISHFDKDPQKHWEITARIERHLRHHRYLYFLGTSDRKRVDLWLKLAMSADVDTFKKLEKRLRLDFLLGQFELLLDNNILPPEMFASVTKDEPTFGRRLELAPAVWYRKPTSQRSVLHLQDQLLSAGWESIAAKVAGDTLARHAIKAHGTGQSRKLSNQIQDSAEAAEALARASGSFWRNFKPTVLKAIWSSNPAVARLDLLSKISAARSIANPMLISGLIAGLIVCELRLILARRPSQFNPAMARNRLIKMLRELALDEQYLIPAFNTYWDQQIPKELEKPFNELGKPYQNKRH